MAQIFLDALYLEGRITTRRRTSTKGESISTQGVQQNLSKKNNVEEKEKLKEAKTIDKTKRWSHRRQDKKSDESKKKDDQKLNIYDQSFRNTSERWR